MFLRLFCPEHISADDAIDREDVVRRIDDCVVGKGSVVAVSTVGSVSAPESGLARAASSSWTVVADVVVFDLLSSTSIGFHRIGDADNGDVAIKEHADWLGVVPLVEEPGRIAS